MGMVTRVLFVASFCQLLTLVAYADDNPNLKEYVPGKLITVERYLKLSRNFFRAWEKSEGFEALMLEANKGAEPEALMAGMKLLASPDLRITYAKFSPNEIPQDGHEVASHDGLLGFRVVRQATLTVNGKPRLLSSIQTYDWDSKLKKMVPIAGADSFRVRAQIDEFVPSGRGKPAQGFVGFSWSAHVKNGVLAKLEARNYVTDDKTKWVGEGHPGTYDPRATPCSWTTHCNVCHHQDALNAVNNFNVPPLKKAGTKQFLSYLKKTRGLPADEIAEVSAALEKPNDAFPREEVQKALLARWRESQKN